MISTRKNWKGPSKDTVMCSDHFEGDCFDPSYDLKKSMGLKRRRDLVKGSVPTNFVQRQPNTMENESNVVRPQPNTMENEYKRVYTGSKSGSAFDKCTQGANLGQLLFLFVLFVWFLTTHQPL